MNTTIYLTDDNRSLDQVSKEEDIHQFGFVCDSGIAYVRRDLADNWEWSGIGEKCEVCYLPLREIKNLLSYSQDVDENGLLLSEKAIIRHDPVRKILGYK
jgi:hypothetical protein